MFRSVVYTSRILTFLIGTGHHPPPLVFGKYNFRIEEPLGAVLKKVLKGICELPFVVFLTAIYFFGTNKKIL